MNKWEQLYRYPDYGISIMYSSLGNREAFGEYTALWPWYRIHFIDTQGSRSITVSVWDYVTSTRSSIPNKTTGTGP